jgi:hypothetical protein
VAQSGRTDYPDLRQRIFVISDVATILRSFIANIQSIPTAGAGGELAAPGLPSRGATCALHDFIYFAKS